MSLPSSQNKLIKDRKVVKILMDLPDSVILEFKKFLNSYLNENKKLGEVLHWIEVLILNEGRPEVDSIDFFHLLKPEEIFNAEYTDQRFARLYAKLKKFFAVSAFLEDEISHPAYIVSSFGKYLKDYNYEKLDKELSKGFENPTQINADYYYKFHNYLASLTIYIQQRREKLTDEFWLSLASSSLDFFLTRYLHLINALEDYNYLTGQQLVLPYKKELLDIVENKSEGLSSLAFANFLSYKMKLKNEDSEGFYKKLKGFIFTENLNWDDRELLSFSAGLLNYCGSKVNEGDLQYDLELSELYDFLVKNPFFLQDGCINPVRLKSLISAKCRIGELEKAQKILNQFESRIINDPLKNAVWYNQSIISFYAGDFDGFLAQIFKIRNTDYNKGYFELDMKFYEIWARLQRDSEYDNNYLLTLIDSFGRFLTRNKERIGLEKTARYKSTLSLLRKWNQLLKSSELNLKKMSLFQLKVTKARSIVNKRYFLYRINQEMAIRLPS